MLHACGGRKATRAYLAPGESKITGAVAGVQQRLIRIYGGAGAAPAESTRRLKMLACNRKVASQESFTEQSLHKAMLTKLTTLLDHLKLSADKSFLRARAVPRLPELCLSEADGSDMVRQLNTRAFSPGPACHRTNGSWTGFFVLTTSSRTNLPKTKASRNAHRSYTGNSP